VSGPSSDPFADRLAGAVVEVIVERGYGATTIAEVVERARTDRAAFEARFHSLEDCVQKVYEAFIDDFKGKVRRAFDSQPGWPASLRAAAYASGEWVDEHPSAAHFGAVEVLSAGNEMIRVRREELFGWCAGLIERGREAADDPEAVPKAAAVIAIGSIVQMMTARMHRGDDLEIARLTPVLMYQAVRPYLGEERAREELTMVRPPLPSPGPGR
jgi:AcrR family transcriptional regulator